MSVTPHGACRYCGCHGESCSLPNGDKCVLSDESGVCNAPGCMRAELARARNAGAARMRPKEFAGWGYGAVAMELRKRRQAKRRRKAA